MHGKLRYQTSCGDFQVEKAHAVLSNQRDLWVCEDDICEINLLLLYVHLSDNRCHRVCRWTCQGTMLEDLWELLQDNKVYIWKNMCKVLVFFSTQQAIEEKLTFHHSDRYWRSGGVHHDDKQLQTDLYHHNGPMMNYCVRHWQLCGNWNMGSGIVRHYISEE